MCNENSRTIPSVRIVRGPDSDEQPRSRTWIDVACDVLEALEPGEVLKDNDGNLCIAPPGQPRSGRYGITVAMSGSRLQHVALDALLRPAIRLQKGDVIELTDGDVAQLLTALHEVLVPVPDDVFSPLAVSQEGAA